MDRRTFMQTSTGNSAASSPKDFKIAAKAVDLG